MMSLPITPEVEDVIFNVHTFFRKRKSDKESLEYKFDMNVPKLVAEATGVSARSVMRLLSDGSSEENETPESSGETRKHKAKEWKIHLDSFQISLIRRKIHHYYLVNKKLPSASKLHEILKDDGIVHCGVGYLRDLLDKMGYKYLKKSKKSDSADSEDRRD